MTIMLACKSRHHQEYHSSTVQMPIWPIVWAIPLKQELNSLGNQTNDKYFFASDQLLLIHCWASMAGARFEMNATPWRRRHYGDVATSQWLQLHLVNDVLGKAGALRAVGESFHWETQLMEHCPRNNYWQQDAPTWHFFGGWMQVWKKKNLQ